MPALRASQADNDDVLFRVGSDPGEIEDAYGAPTKVGPMSKAAIDKLMQDAEASQSPVSGVSAPSKSGTIARFQEPAPAAKVEPAIPVLYDDKDDDGGLDPTRLTNRSVAPSPKAVEIVTKGPASIVSQIVADAVERDEDTTGSVSIEMPTQPKRSSAAPLLAFPEWVAGRPAYAMPLPVAMKERMSDRKLAIVIAASFVGFVACFAPLIWWLFQV